MTTQTFGAGWTVRRYLNEATPGAVILNAAGQQVMQTAGDASTEALRAALLATEGAPQFPVLLSGKTVTFAAYPAATSYWGAWSTAPRGAAGRTTTYSSSAITSPWSPAQPAAGQTLYYGVAASTPSGQVWSSNEVAMVGPTNPTPAPTPTPTPTPTPGGSMRVTAVNASSWGSTVWERYQGAGMTWDRYDVGDGSDLSALEAAVSSGVNVVCLYNPADFSTITGSQHAQNITSLCERLPASVSEILFINEPWFNMPDGGTRGADVYGQLYAAALPAAVAGGKKLICGVYGDWEMSNGTWGTDQNGTGWCGTVVTELKNAGIPISEVPGWSTHPYPVGPPTQLGSGGIGFPELGHRMQMLAAAGSTAPFYVDEFGYQLDGTTTGQALQGTYMTMMCDAMTQSVPAIDAALAAAGYTCRTPFNKILPITFISAYCAANNQSPPAPSEDGAWGITNFIPGQEAVALPAFNALAQFAATVGAKA